MAGRAHHSGVGGSPAPTTPAAHPGGLHDKVSHACWQ
jgi:hypothetical protein